MAIWLALLTAAVVTVVYIICSYLYAPFRTHSLLRRCGIKGPRPVPFFGSILLIRKLGILKFYEELYKAYGPVSAACYGHSAAVIIADTNILKQVMVKEFDSFMDRTMLPLAQTSCSTLVEKLGELANTNKSMDLFRVYGSFTMETIVAIAFGRYINVQNGEQDELTEAAGKIFRTAQEDRILSLQMSEFILLNFPFLAPLFRLLIYTETGSALKVLFKTAVSLVQARRETAGESAKKLEYLDMVIQETLRLYPPAPRTQRTCLKTTKIDDDITIPEGAVVYIPIHLLHHNPEFWPDPEKFDPERFSPEERAKRPQMCHMPFGWGPRNCIGMRFALMEAKLALINILRKYKFVQAPDTEIPLQLVLGITMSPKNGIYLRITSRENNQ